MSDIDTVDDNIDRIRELCRKTIETLRSASESGRYCAALEHAVARRSLCLKVCESWYSALSSRAQLAFRRATEHPWDGDSLCRLTLWDLKMAPYCGEKTIHEIVDSLRSLGIELPERARGSAMVFPLDDGHTPPSQ